MNPRQREQQEQSPCHGDDLDTKGRKDGKARMCGAQRLQRPRAGPSQLLLLRVRFIFSVMGSYSKNLSREVTSSNTLMYFKVCYGYFVGNQQ